MAWKKVMAHPFLLPPQRWKRTLRIVKVLTGKSMAILGSQLQPGVSRAFMWIIPLFAFLGWCLRPDDEMGAVIGFGIGEVIVLAVLCIRSSRTTPGW